MHVHGREQENKKDRGDARLNLKSVPRSLHVIPLAFHPLELDNHPFKIFIIGIMSHVYVPSKLRKCLM
jgi:hypothetical protein